jgi:hypothetical protein
MKKTWDANVFCCDVCGEAKARCEYFDYGTMVRCIECGAEYSIVDILELGQELPAPPNDTKHPIWKVIRPYKKPGIPTSAIIVAASVEEARFMFYENTDKNDRGSIRDYGVVQIDRTIRGIVNLCYPK